MKQRNRRQLLLEAAEQLVQRDGVGKLTLDAVAVEAHVSKGCVLYHFPTKNALIEGMVGCLMNRMEAEEARAFAADAAEPGRFARAYIRAAAAFLPDETEAGRTSAGIFAAVANDPTLLERLQDRFAQTTQRLELDGLDQIDVTILRLAMDGLWFAELFGFAPPSGELRTRVIERLLQSAGAQPDLRLATEPIEPLSVPSGCSTP